MHFAQGFHHASLPPKTLTPRKKLVIILSVVDTDGFLRPPGLIMGGSASGLLEIFGLCGDSLREGNLATGITDIAGECMHTVAATGNHPYNATFQVPPLICDVF